MLRKNLYRWHWVLSLVITLPVLLWAISGFLHPLMTSVRPAVKTQSIPEDTLGSAALPVSFRDILHQNRIDTLYSVRLVHIGPNWFYQVRATAKGALQYYSARNGQFLKKGDWLYAQYLAREFLEGQRQPLRQTPVLEHPMPVTGGSGMDCCSDASAAILDEHGGAVVSGASLVTAFEGEYKSVYSLLPVYKVSFDRQDKIRLYVETGQDRFAAAVDQRRATFTRFFDLLHTWGWLDFLGKGRLYAEAAVCGLALVTALMGLYLFFRSKSKRVPGKPLVAARRRHRFTSVIASLFTLMFTFSGAYHAWYKTGMKEKEVLSALQPIVTSGLELDLEKLRQAAPGPLTNIGLVKIAGIIYWQVYYQAPGMKSKSADLMKDMSSPARPVVYFRNGTSGVLTNGDQRYAKNLAAQFSGRSLKAILSAQLITKFTDEYNFTDKRLPVWKITFSSKLHDRCYVETTSGILAKNTNDAALTEGYSFALLHKQHYMDFAGKTGRDTTAMIGAGLQVLMVIMGLLYYFKWRKRKVKY